MLGVIIPARNERDNIGAVIESLILLKVLPKDIFLVDSLSTDDTVSVGQSYGINILSATKLGYQAALSCGLNALLANNYRDFLIVDGDNEIRLQAIKKFLDAQCNYPELSIGVRPKAKRIGELITNSFFNYKYGIKDILCGVKRGNLNLFNPKNSLEYGLDLFHFSEMNGHVKNIDIDLIQRNESRLGGTLAVNIGLIKNLIFYIFRLVT
jgi:glycosyltransferase involved in cell wall biosynthesis